MAGGPTTVALALAVAEAGGFPFLAGGYKTAEALHAEIQQLQAKNVPLGVNIFVPSNATVDPAALSAYADELTPEAEHYGLQLDPCPISDDDHWDDKIALLTTHPVPVVSFTFSLPPRGIITTLHEPSTQALITVTTPDEAVRNRTRRRRTHHPRPRSRWTQRHLRPHADTTTGRPPHARLPRAQGQPLASDRRRRHR